MHFRQKMDNIGYLKDKADHFYQPCNIDWSGEVYGQQALSTLNENRYNRPKRIPLAEDIKKRHMYLEEKAGTLRKLLEESPNEKTWRQFCEITLLQIVLFNRQRGGEMERMNIDNYTKAITNSCPVQGEIAGSLSAIEKALTKSIARVEMRGEKKRKVAVLRTAQYTNQINLQIKTRSVGNIDNQNQYLYRRRMRRVAKLLMECRKLQKVDKQQSFEDFITPEFVDTMIDASTT